MFMNFYYSYSKIARKSIDALKIKLDEITTSDNPNQRICNEIADSILYLSAQIDAAYEIAQKLRENGIFPDQIKKMFFDQLSDKNHDNLAKKKLN